jgi:hypothetical protein
LEALTDISVLGITDYFSVEGYRYVYEARKNGRLTNIALVLPNIEFRLNKTIAVGTETKRLSAPPSPKPAWDWSTGERAAV